MVKCDILLDNIDKIADFIDEGKNTRHFSDGMNCRHI